MRHRQPDPSEPSFQRGRERDLSCQLITATSNASCLKPRKQSSVYLHFVNGDSIGNLMPQTLPNFCLSEQHYCDLGEYLHVRLCVEFQTSDLFVRHTLVYCASLPKSQNKLPSPYLIGIIDANKIHLCSSPLANRDTMKWETLYFGPNIINLELIYYLLLIYMFHIQFINCN